MLAAQSTQEQPNRVKTLPNKFTYNVEAVEYINQSHIKKEDKTLMTDGWRSISMPIYKIVYDLQNVADYNFIKLKSDTMKL